MSRRTLMLGWMALALALSLALVACGPARGDDGTGSESGLVAFGDLVAHSDRYAGQRLCTEGVYASGFEVNDLGASTYDKDGYTWLSEPVIWLEGANFQSLEDCTGTDTQPPFEFCQAVVCGVFETGGGYGHVGAYEFQIRGEGIRPASTPLSPVVNQPTAEDLPPVSEDGDAVGLEVRPPAAVLEVAGREQASGIGSYCWRKPTGSDSAVAVCADTLGIITPEQPLAVPPTLAARFRLAPAGEPVELALRVLAISPEEEIAMDLDGWRAWPGKAGELHQLALEREPEIDLVLTPGLYVLELFARWEEWGDASYGFLVEVAGADPLTAAGEAPNLLIDETPIIADALDRPGRFEYMDVLGEGILARIEGLRARDAELRLAEANEVLAPFGYRLESYFDGEWNRTFYDLVREGVAQPVLPGLSYFWPVSANTSGTDFVMAAENAPNTFPLYLLVHKETVEEWDAMTSNLLAPAYVGDALATITTTPEMTFTYQVLLDGQVAYTGNAVMVGAYHPLRSFTTWDGHWVLEVDDHLIVDGQDLGVSRGYDAVFGFTRIQNRAFYFYEQDGQVRISYGGRTLPNAYDRVFHNQCCEAAIHNVERLANSVLFHALWQGTWCFVEAGVFDGEMAGTYRYTAPESWSFRYPAHWDRWDPELGLVQETATGKTVTFDSAPATQAELEAWLESEIARKLEASEAENTLAEPLSKSQDGDLTVYRYAIRSRLESGETLLRTTVFFDGQRRYAFDAGIPPVAEEEYEAIIGTLEAAGR